MILIFALGVIVFRGSSAEAYPGRLSGLSFTSGSGAVFVEPTQEDLLQMNSISAVGALGEPESEFPVVSIEHNSIIPNSSVVATIDVDELVDRGADITEYIVREGDVLSSIAFDYGVKTNTLIWANDISNPDKLRAGSILLIPPINGVIHSVVDGDTVSGIAGQYKADIDDIITFNGLPLAGNLKIGDEIIVPDGVIRSSSSGRSVTLTRFAHLPTIVGFYALPVGSGALSRGGAIHGRNGVDIPKPCGTSVFAAASGTVKLARYSGWNGGGGKMVMISHSNGTESLYAHMSAVYAKEGTTVAQGQLIGLVGSTGNSTGCHLHFELHGAKNPYKI